MPVTTKVDDIGVSTGVSGGKSSWVRNIPLVGNWISDFTSGSSKGYL